MPKSSVTGTAAGNGYKHMKNRIRCLILLLSILTVFPVLKPVVQASEPENRIENLMDSMSLHDKITQMMMMDFRYWNGADFTEMNAEVAQILSEYHFGAVILFSNNIQDPSQTLTLTNDLQQAAIAEQNIPLLIATDQEGGSVVRYCFGTPLPGNMALGAAGSESYALQAGQILGSELRALGINTNLAPVADINSNANNPVIGLRSFSDDPEHTGLLASAMIRGMAEQNVIACAKHFPGHGDTETDSHYGLPVIDRSPDELMDHELKPFQMAIEQDVDMIMTAHILFPQLDSSRIRSDKTGQKEMLPATMSKAVITDLLKETMGYNGVVCTDSLEMEAVAGIWDPVQAAVLSINAGSDMLCMPLRIHSSEDLQHLDALIQGIADAVKEDHLTLSRIDDAVTRILTLKEKRGILDYDASLLSLDSASSVPGNSTFLKMQSEMTASSITLIKNKEQILPLSGDIRKQYLILAPTEAQCRILKNLWSSLSVSGSVSWMVYEDPKPSGIIQKQIKNADVLILLSSLSDVSQFQTAPCDIAAFAAENGTSCIVIASGLPYDIQLYDAADAILAIYGPYQEINLNSMLKVLFGIHKACGTLPVDIPLYDPDTCQYTESSVYLRGYGLSYDSFLPIGYTSDMLLTQKWNATDPSIYSARTKKSWIPYFRFVKPLTIRQRLG